MFPTPTPPPTIPPELISPDSNPSKNSELIALIVGVASTVFGTLIYDYIKQNTSVRVKVIKKSSDKDIEGFVDLYNKLINEDIRIDPAEIISWIDEDRALRKVKTHNYLHYLLVGKLSGEVVSFLKVMYCTDSKYLFIAYYGIDTENEKARRLAAPAMIKGLSKLIMAEMKDCKGIVLEVQAPSPKIDFQENNERKARIRLFKETAKRLNYRMYEVGIDYLQPQMDINSEDEFEEEKMILLYAPVNDTVPYNKKISKDKVLEILNFIYLQIYRPTFRHDPEKDFAYQVYLNSLLRDYEANLPQSISLKD